MNRSKRMRFLRQTLFGLWRKLLGAVAGSKAFSRKAGASEVRGDSKAGALFHLRSEHFHPPENEAEELRSFRMSARKRLESGILFGDLASAAARGVVICAHIEAAGGKGPRHLLVVFPKC